MNDFPLGDYYPTLVPFGGYLDDIAAAIADLTYTIHRRLWRHRP